MAPGSPGLAGTPEGRGWMVPKEGLCCVGCGSDRVPRQPHSSLCGSALPGGDLGPSPRPGCPPPLWAGKAAPLSELSGCSPGTLVPGSDHSEAGGSRPQTSPMSMKTWPWPLLQPLILCGLGGLEHPGLSERVPAPPNYMASLQGQVRGWPCSTPRGGALWAGLGR